MAKQRASKRKSNSASKSTKREKSLLNSTGAFSSNVFASKPVSVPVPAPEPEPTVLELISSATSLLHEQNNPTEALALTTHALTLAPTSLPALELLAEIRIELGDEDTARAIFEKAVELDPRGEGSGPEKFLWLAQLGQGGEKMMEWYTRGVDVLRRWIQNRDGNGGDRGGGRKGKMREISDERRLDEKLCSALCAMAEIYMSDLCMEPDAEERCEKYVTEALLVVPTSAEALQTLASVRISQQRVDDAVAALNRSFGLWKDLDLASAEIPTYASRVNLSKLLIETGQYETALEVLERLQLEDDQLPDLWYLGGWCLFLLGQQETEGCREQLDLWETSREWLQNCEKLYVMLEWEDEGIKEHASELLANINDVLPEQMEDEQDGEDDDDDDDDEEEEWEDDEDDDMVG